MLINIREKESNELMRQKDTKIEEHVEAVTTLKNDNTRLKNEISDLGIVMESTTRGLQEEKVNNDIKNCKIEELNEKGCIITEEKMKMKSENDKSIEDLKLCKKVAEEKFLSRQEVSKEII